MANYESKGTSQLEMLYWYHLTEYQKPTNTKSIIHDFPYNYHAEELDKIRRELHERGRHYEY